MVEDGVDASTGLPGLPGLLGLLRSVRAPEFPGPVFRGVEARLVRNRVPGPSPVPFRRTVKPHRSCSHACAHCLAGATRVLLADGRTRPIGELRVGDRVLGTQQVDGGRRYVPTTVLAHWSTRKPAHRVRLMGGTEIVASGEHRFLSERGWRHISSGWCRSGRRRHLRAGSALVGPGPVAPARSHSAAYRQGYLCGLARSDAPRGAFPSPQLELEALGRAHHFLALAGSRPAPSLSAVGGSEPGRVPPPVERGGIAPIGDATRWPARPGDDWCAGLLAGAADARGAVTRGELGVTHADEEVVGRVAGALHRLGFRFAIEPAGPLRVVRLLGGPASFLRFLQVVDPAVSRVRELAGAPVQGGIALEVESVQPLGTEVEMYDITTGTGDFVAEGVVSHNCSASS